MRHQDRATRFVGLRGGQDTVTFSLGIDEMLKQHCRVGLIEVPARIFLLGLAEDVAIGQRDRAVGVVERHVHDVTHAQDIHRQTLQPIGQLARNRVAVVAADLLEIGELADFHAIAPNLPAQAPGAQRRAFPVILDKADVVQAGVDANGVEAAKIERLKVGRRGLYQHLILIVVLQTVRVLAIAPVSGAARGLHIRRRPRPGAKAAQRGCRVKGARAHFHVVGLQDGTAFGRPIGLKPKDDFLKTAGSGACRCHRQPRLPPTLGRALSIGNGGARVNHAFQPRGDY
ncbi:hypothetical protein GALL_530390 [mine drainage metagenome]|uniref:Uncharacterized protein n=1 Tax=mine drainage metagenome TaxID=410659 RepID=A0A1J5P2W2_9ZZZZ